MLFHITEPGHTRLTHKKWMYLFLARRLHLFPNGVSNCTAEERHDEYVMMRKAEGMECGSVT